VMVSSTNAAYNLTVNNSASGHYALVVMTITAVLFVPVILLYQGWSFHVFRGRLSGPSQEADPEQPVAATGASGGTDTPPAAAAGAQ
jgi:cytochrome d ubiquinol oxidase subunit II